MTHTNHERDVTQAFAHGEVPIVGSQADAAGLAILLTGLSGAGKTTLAKELLGRLRGLGKEVTFLDGDDLRSRFWPDLGFSSQDRGTNLRIAAAIASEAVRHGGIAICSFIAPHDTHRVEFRETLQKVGMFALVHVSTPLEECERRDPKGLYRKARSGDISHFTGISDVYEEPPCCDIQLDTTGMTASRAADIVIQKLARYKSSPALWRAYGRRMPNSADNGCDLSKAIETDALSTRLFCTILDRLSCDSPTVTALARNLGISRHAIERNVRLITGGTFRDLQQSLAGEKASCQLRSGATIKEVAFALGFSSPQAFHRFYKKACGCTPTVTRTRRADKIG